MSRRRYRWDEELKQIVEVGADLEPAERRAQTSTEELVYGGMRATDGSDISTRRKHREYMRRNNLTTADDFKSTWKNAEKERDAIRRGDFDHKARREAVERAVYKFHKP